MSIKNTKDACTVSGNELKYSKTKLPFFNQIQKQSAAVIHCK